MSVEQTLNEIQTATRNWIKENGPLTDAVKSLQYETNVGFHKKQKVVKCSTVLTAIHLMAARWMCRAMPEMIKKKIELFAIKGGEEILARQVAQQVLGKVFGVNVLSGLFRDVLQAGAEVVAAREVEAMIRDSMAVIRSEFNGIACLKQGKSRGSVRDVHSRHRTRKKRKQKPWRSR